MLLRFSILTLFIINTSIWLADVTALPDDGTSLSRSKVLSGTQIDMILNTLHQAGVPASANSILLETLDGSIFTIRTRECQWSYNHVTNCQGTNTGKQFEAWSSPSNLVGEAIEKSLAADGIYLRPSIGHTQKRDAPDQAAANSDSTQTSRSMDENEIDITRPDDSTAEAHSASDILKSRTAYSSVPASYSQIHRRSEALPQKIIVNNSSSPYLAATGRTPDGLVLHILTTDGNTSVGEQVDHIVQVGGVYGTQYFPSYVMAKAGDTVSFIFGTGNHTVTRSSFLDPCSHAGQTTTSGYIPSIDDLSSADKGTAPVLRYTVDSTAPQWFYCAKADHCQRGMIFVINPSTVPNFESDSDTQSVERTSSTMGSYPIDTSTDSAGDTFGSATNYDVWATSTKPYVTLSTSFFSSVIEQVPTALATFNDDETTVYAVETQTSTVFPPLAVPTLELSTGIATFEYGGTYIYATETQTSTTLPSPVTETSEIPTSLVDEIVLGPSSPQNVGAPIADRTLSASSVEATGLVLGDPSYAGSNPVPPSQTILLPTYIDDDDDESPGIRSTERATVIKTLSIGGEEQACYAATKAFARDNEGGCFGFVFRLRPEKPLDAVHGTISV